MFNHQSNVDINNRIVCYDIKELGKQLKKIGMLVVQDQVWNRVTINRAAHKSTRYYIDEMHLLLKEEQTAAYTVEIWKRFRKWGGIPTGITQNVKDLALASARWRTSLKTPTSCICSTRLGGDRQILAKQLGISPTSFLCDPLQRGRGPAVLWLHDPAFRGPLPQEHRAVPHYDHQTPGTEKKKKKEEQQENPTRMKPTRCWVRALGGAPRLRASRAPQAPPPPPRRGAGRRGGEGGGAGLPPLTEIWCAMNGVPAIVIFEGGQSELLANVVAQIYAHLLQHPSP